MADRETQAGNAAVRADLDEVTGVPGLRAKLIQIAQVDAQSAASGDGWDSVACRAGLTCSEAAEHLRILADAMVTALDVHRRHLQAIADAHASYCELPEHRRASSFGRARLLWLAGCISRVPQTAFKMH